MKTSRIIWTRTDEAPALASESLLPVVRSFLKAAGIDVDEYDISLAGRIIAGFSDRLPPDKRIPDYLGTLGREVGEPGTNIIKLPNISASIPQLRAAIRELQEKGYEIPDFPESAQNPDEKEVRDRFAGILGSAVNPVLREGNADRRAALSVKSFARKHPHKMMKPWPESGSKTRVAHMEEKDFYGSEQSITLDAPLTVNIEFHPSGGDPVTLKQDLALTGGEVVDTAVMNVRALREFYAAQIARAGEEGDLLSLHLKATMMKVSDPIMFGHCISVFFSNVFEKHGPALASAGVDVKNGLADVLDKIKSLPAAAQKDIRADIDKAFAGGPALAMVDSDNGITNLHFPNNVIIDASMPNIIRDGGRMWNPEGRLQDTVAMIPDRCYATIYQTVIDDCKANGQFDPATMGSVSNVGLMAKKAEEYGSHDKTFEATGNGKIMVVAEDGECLLSQEVEKGDIFRMCRAQDIAVQDWIKLAVARANDSDTPAVFWLDPDRAHDRRLIEKVETGLSDLDTGGAKIRIMAPVDAMSYTLERVRKGEDTIAVTGNVLRDYLTDLFPILELGTSAKMLSIVPLLNGGGLFETGAGGSAPKHVEQFLKEGHLRWDSLGEYCALVPSLEHIARTCANEKAAVFARALDQAISLYLESGKSPSRKVNEIDNRGSSFYIALYWAKCLAGQASENPTDIDEEIAAIFGPLAKALEENEDRINEELLAAQGTPVDISGYYLPDPEKTVKAMRPSPVFNQIIEGLLA